MTDAPAISPDHMALLTIARAAFKARDDRHLWRQDVSKAAAEHGAACDAIWEELERQVAQFDGLVPVAEHPALKRRKMIAQMRTEIVATAQNAIIEAMEELARGPMLDDYT
jgi:putative protein kinase ArgK-like GTPase of G3E family